MYFLELKMALFKYFKRIDPKKGENIDAVLPKIDDPLSNVMPKSPCKHGVHE